MTTGNATATSTAPDRKSAPPQGRAHRCDIHRVARQCGVKLFDGGRVYKSVRGAGECFSPATLRRIGRAHGEGHLALVLRLIVETEGNAKELFAETLWAVSELICNRPDLLDRGTALFDAFDGIDLAGLRRQAKTMQCGLPPGHVMRVLLAMHFSQPTSRPC